jgi:cytochrome P450
VEQEEDSGMSVSDEATAERRHVGDYTMPSAEVTACPYPFYEALRSEAPVYHYPGRNEYLVSRHEDIVKVVKDTELFSNAAIAEDDPAYGQIMGQGSAEGCPMRPSNMFFSDPPEHKEKRHLAYPMFSLERQKAYEPLIRDTANELIDAFIDRGECDFRTEFADLLPLYVVSSILGLSREDIPIWRPFGDSEGLATRYLDEEAVRKEAEEAAQAMAYMEEQVRKRIEHPTDDYLSEFIQAQIARDGEPNVPYLTQESAISLLTAGTVTTTHLLASTMLLLLQHSDELDRVAADPSLIKPLIEESLRIEAPVQWGSRRATRDTELGGVKIPAGAMVLVMLASGNRDPEIFDDPDRFWIERPNAVKHLAFGNGRHTCLGAPLARQMGRLSFEVILSRMTNFKLLETSPLTLGGIAFRGPQIVKMSFDAAAA